ncbi:hypothetical protein HDU86_006132 [Geranomyces michiganensis]|nr:hypothetical protein HDU86_006132 [Geranomyces michiganensis]
MSNDPPVAHDPAALLAQAQKALDDCHPDLASKFLLRALEAAPTNVAVLTTLGIAEMEKMNAAEDDDSPELSAAALTAARGYFLQAADLATKEGFEPFVYLGQLSAGEEALGFYEKGAALLEGMLEGCAGSEEEPLLRRKLSDALCSMAEIFMTDCCDAPDAESRCEDYVLRAVSADPTNPDAHQTLASMRLSQCRNSDAAIAIAASMDLWFTAPDPKHAMPPYPARINLTKILLELSLHDRALDVLKTIEEENDEDPEGWYLYGWCLYRIGGGGEEQGNGGMAVEGELPLSIADKSDAWAEATECFEHFMQLQERFGAEEGMIEHTAQLLAEITPFLKKYPPSNPAEVKDPGDYDDDAMEV